MKDEKQKISELEFPACPDQLALVRAAAATAAHEVGFAQDDIDYITLAVTEAFTNIIRHGYKDCQDGKIVINNFHLNDPAGLKITLRDFGRQVDPCEICSRDLDDIRPGGLGVHIIKTLMDSVKYEKAESKGMILTMVKYLD